MEIQVWYNNQYFNRIRQKIGPDGFLCVVIDACHSGNASRDEDDDDNQIIRGVNIGFSENGRTFAPKINNNGCFKIESRHDYGDILILEACRAYQNNYEINVDGKYYGSLSYYMCKVLNNKPITKNIDWVLEIKSLMQADPRLQNQNMVYEKSFWYGNNQQRISNQIFFRMQRSHGKIAYKNLWH